MPYLYEDTVKGSPRNALTIPSSTSDVLREQFAQTFEENPIMAARRWNELSNDQKTGPIVPAKDARQKLKDAGLENDLKVSDAGITQAALDTLIFRKRMEKRRQEIYARSEGGFGEGAARLGVAIATTLSDPISAGLNFVPIVGQARYARWLANAGSVAGRVGVRAGVGALEGAAGAAIAEPFIYTMRTQEQADYDTTDSLLNVAFGGVIGSGLHVTVGSLGELYSRLRPEAKPNLRIEPTMDGTRTTEPLPENVRRAIFDQPQAADIVAAMTSEAQQTALRAAVGQAIEGRKIEVEPIINASTVNPDDVYLHGTSADFDQFKVGGHGAIYFSHEQTFAQRQQISQAEHIAGGPFGGRLVRAEIKGGKRFDPLNDSRARQIFERALPGKPVKQWVDYPDMPDIVKLATPEGYNRFRVYEPSVQGFSEAITDPSLVRILSRADTRQSVAQSVTKQPDQIDPEYRAATEQAEATLARDVENTTEANLKTAEEEATLAEAEAKELAKRLGIDMKEDADIAAITEAADKAERWARVAELATVCLVRGG